MATKEHLDILADTEVPDESEKAVRMADGCLKHPDGSVELTNEYCDRFVADLPTPLEQLAKTFDPSERTLIEGFLKIESQIKAPLYQAFDARTLTLARPAFRAGAALTRSFIKAIGAIGTYRYGGIQRFGLIYSDGPTIGADAKVETLRGQARDTPDGRLLVRIEGMAYIFRDLGDRLVERSSTAHVHIGDEAYARCQGIRTPTQSDVAQWMELANTSYQKMTDINVAAAKYLRRGQQVTIIAGQKEVRGRRDRPT